MNDTSQLIHAALISRDFAMLIGRVEDDVFEAKGPQPYDFSKPQSQYELAKDVSAFANADGGWIIIGLRHRKVADRAVDAIDALDLLAASGFYPNELKGRIQTSVRPDIVGLDVRWVENAGTPGMGVGIIHVPKQDVDRKPFLIYRVIESGEKLDHIVFGCAQRVGDASNPLSFEHIQQRMRNGMTSGAQRITRMESQLDRIQEAVQSLRQPPEGSRPAAVDRDMLRKRIAQLSGDE